MKLWKKNTSASHAVTDFTVGNDQTFDLQLAPFDILGSLAHVKMLGHVKLLHTEETNTLVKALQQFYQKTKEPDFTLHPECEDIHSQIEWMLTQQLGDTGKKIHTARSRNDQVLVDLKLFFREEIKKTVQEVVTLFTCLQRQSEKFKGDLLPGYTHLQLAMPSSFGLWLGAYAESLCDDLIGLEAAFQVVNKNPLGSAAGYGSSFPIDRSYTTRLLGFDDMHYNVVYAQMSRGKTERLVAQALAGVAETLSRFSMDACLYMNQEFGYISFPDELTTGSSIMPHKKNPDVFELVRGHCNRIKGLPNEIMLLTTNLPSGYHRELQLLKEHLFPAFTTLRKCMQMLTTMIDALQIKKDLLLDERYQLLFSVEAVNKLVQQGIPFRDAYRQVGVSIEEGRYQFKEPLLHTHEGSIGQLCNEKVAANLQGIVNRFPFTKIDTALQSLLDS
ncbi:MAG: argininosuccinate lyase [Chitinophagia bacterium]|nr:argininosuccinate lyase [Chitinophagia bacterium]